MENVLNFVYAVNKSKELELISKFNFIDNSEENLKIN